MLDRNSSPQRSILEYSAGRIHWRTTDTAPESRFVYLKMNCSPTREIRYNEGAPVPSYPSLNVYADTICPCLGYITSSFAGLALSLPLRTIDTSPLVIYLILRCAFMSRDTRSSQIMHKLGWRRVMYSLSNKLENFVREQDTCVWLVIVMEHSYANSFLHWSYIDRQSAVARKCLAALSVAVTLAFPSHSLGILGTIECRTGLSSRITDIGVALPAKSKSTLSPYYFTNPRERGGDLVRVRFIAVQYRSYFSWESSKRNRII